MKKIGLTQGKVVLVDDEDFEYLMQWNWSINAYGYAVRNSGGATLFMHRDIMKCKYGMDTDHIDHNPLNNQKQNLRVCTHKQNLWNSLPTRKFKGVSKTLYNKYRSRICCSGKQICLGNYSTAIDAAKAYNTAAVKHFGEFACLNKIEE